MDIRSSKGVRFTGPSIKFTGYSQTPQRRCSESYWTLPHVRRTLGMTGHGKLITVQFSLCSQLILPQSGGRIYVSMSLAILHGHHDLTEIKWH